MAKQYYSVLTDYGTQVIAGAIARKQPLQITQMAVGDGNGQATTPNSRNTGLVREVHRADISAISVDPRNDKQIIFELTIPENVGGFWIREMGIFDNQNRLVAYANCPDSFKPQLESGSGKVQVVRMILLVSSSDAITLKVDDSVIFVTRGQLTPKAITATTKNAVDESGHSHEIDKASTSQAGIVTLDSSIDSKAENKAATPKAVKTAYDKAKAADDNANTRVSKSGGEMTGGLKLKVNYGTSEKKWDYSGFYAGSATLNNEALPYFQIHIGSYGGNTAEYAKSLGFNLTDYKAYVMNWNSEGEYAGKKEILTELHRSNSVTSASSETVATSKAVKDAYDKAVDGVNKANAAQTAANNAQTTANAAIPSSKKSDSVTSASSETVATSKAVKTAYDKAVDGVNKAGAAQTAANNAQTTANAAIPSSKKSDSVASASSDTVATSKAVKSANDNANGRVSKSGDTMTGKLTVSEINLSGRKLQFGDDYIYKRSNGAPDAFVFFENTEPSDGSKGNANLSFRSASALHYGSGKYVNQYNSKAPYFVEEDNSDVYSYFPFVKGCVRRNSRWGAALSLGYVTSQHIGGGFTADGFGAGIVQLIENNGNYFLWKFEHGGIFRSSGDVVTGSGVSLNGVNSRVDYLTNTVNGLKLTQNLAATGWCRLPNGLLLQWGAGSGAGKKQFPVAFRQVYQVVSSSTCRGDANYDLDLFFNNTHVWGRYQTNIRYFAIGV
ncbi:phage tail protein [Gallibacterium anatis]|uniref:phage tail-collar fiber domain-containing protein n=1 Tax=Gallibacterium anatis TaxID=750 RepID=UPI003003C902